MDDTGGGALGMEGINSCWVKQNMLFLQDPSKTSTENIMKYCE